MQVYKVIREIELATLEREVNNYLSAGWKLNGGISAVMQFTATIYHQSLYKEVPND